MPIELQELIKKANEALAEAQGARSEVLDYLEEHYDINDTSGYDYFEEECNWCYGLNTEKIEMAIKQHSK